MNKEPFGYFAIYWQYRACQRAASLANIRSHTRAAL